MQNRFEDLSGFEFNGVHVRTKNIIGFGAQKWPVSDPLEQRETAIFFFYPDEPAEDAWAVRYVGEATGIHGCAVFEPNERWVFITDDGQVYVVGQGDDDWESPISNRKNLYFANVKSVRSGHAIAVGPRRKVFLREAANQWTQLDTGLFPQGDETDLENAGFNDIDGFSEQDMYACGGKGDLWHYNGLSWRQIDIPVNLVLKNICCGDDGLAYVTTGARNVLRGRGDDWEVIDQDLTDEVFESIVRYDGKVLISTVSNIFAIEDGEFKTADLEVPEMQSKAHLASGDGILVVAGRDEAVMYDGQAWPVILEPAQ